MKTIVLSAKGLHNLNNFPDSGEDFAFFYSDECSFKMKINYSEFISPKVSKLRQVDSTTNSLSFNYNQNDLLEYFTDDVFSLLHSLSIGSSVDINHKVSNYL